MERTEYINIPKEKFRPAENRDMKHDKKLETKPVSYFKDAWLRFRKNKGSVFAFGIIVLLVLFSIIAPMVSPYTVEYNDNNFKNATPRNGIFYELGWDFWDGYEKKVVNEKTFLQDNAIGIETGDLVVKRNEFTTSKDQNGKLLYTYRKDTYQQTGCILKTITEEEYLAIQAYQDENDVQVIYPAVNALKKTNSSWEKKYPTEANDPNRWYKMMEIPAKTADGGLSKTKKQIVPDIYQKNEKGKIVYDEDNNPIILFNEDGSVAYQHDYRKFSGKLDENGVVTSASKDGYVSKMRIEGEGVYEYDYAIKMQGNMYDVRVNYYSYYGYYHQEVLKDGITKPSFIFGATQYGQDIFTRLGSGARLSFLLAISVSLVNMLVGAIYGAIEGYYGGKLDLFMERFSDILSAVPFMIVISLLKFHLGDTGHLTILFISFFLTGWIGMAARVRMQFYRFKNQEYVLAARTLGASDRRIMFKHIFPNSLGTIITGSIVSIPGMIFSESSLSYLGIINLETGSMTSIGNMLASARSELYMTPHIIVPPALFICLLMLSFNLFGNGLRDAFNPSLRGSED